MLSSIPTGPYPVKNAKKIDSDNLRSWYYRILRVWMSCEILQDRKLQKCFGNIAKITSIFTAKQEI